MLSLQEQVITPLVTLLKHLLQIFKIQTQRLLITRISKVSTGQVQGLLLTETHGTLDSLTARQAQ